MTILEEAYLSLITVEHDPMFHEDAKEKFSIMIGQPERG
jgi:hypothetical protein